MQKKRTDIRNLSIDELTICIEDMGEKPFRSKQIDEWLWQKAASSFDEMTSISKPLREKLNIRFIINKALLEMEQTSSDGTIKNVFTLSDGHIVEGVLIPTNDRATACISSQIGCALKCTFCATGKLKYQRNLTAGEIYDQVTTIKKQAEEKLGLSLTNIVLMGMGEPLLNYENVIRFVEIITSKRGLAYSPGRITLSTVGLVKMIKQLADDKVKFNLAISLHAATDKKRNMIIPVNKTNNLKDLAASLRYFHSKTRSRITFEYILLKGINDSQKDARDLAEFCKIVPCKINIIEYNPVKGLRFEKPEKTTVDQFVKFLEGRNLIVNMRRSRGSDIDAACGQLAGKVIK